MGKKTDEDATNELSLDAILDVLSHQHRRAILRWVRDQPQQRGDSKLLIKHLVQQERERVGKTPNSDHIQAALYHIHLPKLSEAGLVVYDEDTLEFQYLSNDRLENWLELIDSKHGSEW